METHTPWAWSDEHQRFYKYLAENDVIWAEPSEAEDSGVTPSGSGWTPSTYYGRDYKYVYGNDHTIIDTLWSHPGAPKETEAVMRSARYSEWTWSAHYNSYYRLMYGEEGIILKTIWEPTSMREAVMLMNSASRAVHFEYRNTGYVTTSHYIPIQYRSQENDRERQRDDRNDRNRHGRSGYRDSDPSGGNRYPDNGDQPDNGDETQSSPESSHRQWSQYHSYAHYPATLYPTVQNPLTWR